MTIYKYIEIHKTLDFLNLGAEIVQNIIVNVSIPSLIQSFVLDNKASLTHYYTVNFIHKFVSRPDVDNLTQYSISNLHKIEDDLKTEF